MKDVLAVLCVFGIILGSISCCKQSNKIESNEEKITNPNGDSELTRLMREMFEEGERIRIDIENGMVPTGLKNFETIHTAVPTDEDASGPVFESFANSYIESVKQLKSSDSSSIFRFNNMVNQCMNCHTEFCPGPKHRIKKLYIEHN